MKSRRRVAISVEEILPLLDPITDGGEGWRMVMPLEKRERVLQDSHYIRSAGHLGVDKTYDRVAREYF